MLTQLNSFSDEMGWDKNIEVSGCVSIYHGATVVQSSGQMSDYNYNIMQI